VPVIRYEHRAPGDLLHLDIKHLVRLTEIAARADGRRRGKHHRGWEYLDVAIDDHSRIPFSQVLPNFTGASAVAFLRAAVTYYATLGIRIRRLLTDNGHGYRSDAFRQACLQLGLTLPAPTGKPNASSKPLSANGSTPVRIKTPNNETRKWPHGFITPTRIVPTIVSTTLHLSAALA
jgi:Integrase core domain